MPFGWELLTEKNNATPMKVLLQDKRTGAYFKEPGVTTRDTGDAMDFLSSSRAIEYCAVQKLNGMQIVLRFDDQHHDIILPMVMDSSHQHARLARTARSLA